MKYIACIFLGLLAAAGVAYVVLPIQRRAQVRSFATSRAGQVRDHLQEAGRNFRAYLKTLFNDKPEPESIGFKAVA